MNDPLATYLHDHLGGADMDGRYVDRQPISQRLSLPAMRTTVFSHWPVFQELRSLRLAAHRRACSGEENYGAPIPVKKISD